MPELFDVLALQEGRNIYYISPEQTKIFYPKEGKNVVIAIKIQTNLCFSVKKNVVPVEDIVLL